MREIRAFILLAWFVHLVACMPKALIHIGPHKAASTHIESFFHKYRDLFARNNYFWPYHPNGSPFYFKAIANVAFALRNMEGNENILRDAQAFVVQARNADRNIILSSEELVSLEPDALERLKQLLLGFDVTIVYVYRELISHCISGHYQDSLISPINRFTSSFAHSLVKYLDNPRFILEDIDNVDRYARVFGRDKIRIVDMMGSKQTGKDITYTLACEIMGVLCDEKDIYEDKSLESNVHMGLLVMEVFSYYNSFIEQHHEAKCHFCDPNLVPAANKFYLDYMALIHSDAVYVLPTVTTSAKMLIPYAIQHDTDLRAKYGDLMLHGNVTANLEAMQHEHTEMLDVEAFFQKVPWLKAFESILQKWKVEKLVCDC